LFNKFSNQIHYALNLLISHIPAYSVSYSIYYFERLTGVCEHRWKTLTTACKKLTPKILSLKIGKCDVYERDEFRVCDKKNLLPLALLFTKSY
jgi:hypothetical protein